MIFLSTSFSSVFQLLNAKIVIDHSMAKKPEPLLFSIKVLSRIRFTARISSLSCTNTIQTNNNTPDDVHFDAQILSLRNSLCPDRLIQVLDNTSDLNSAVKIFKWVSLQKRFQHTADTYCKMILKVGLAGNIDEMERLCKNMVMDRCPDAKEAFISLVSGFVEHCRIDEAVRVLVCMINFGGFRPSVDVFNAVFSGVKKERRGFVEMLFVYKEMVKARVMPNVDTLNFLLEVLFETGRIECGLDQFRRMKMKGCSPNCRTFEIVISGLVVTNRVDDALTILGEMFDVRLLPDMSFYAQIIPLFCSENKLEEAIRLYRMMRDSNYVPDVSTYEELILCLCENHRLDYAYNILEEMVDNGLIPADDVLIEIVVRFCGEGNFEKSMNILEDICTHLTVPHNAMLKSCSAGKFSMAKCILEKMATRNITDCDSWNIPIRWLCENMEFRKAKELLGRMIVSSVVPDCSTYSALVIGNCRFNKNEDAFKVFRKVCANFWVLDSISYSLLVEGLCQEEKIAEAAEVFHYMSEKGWPLCSSSFSTLINGMCKIGKVDEAIRLRYLSNISGTFISNSAYSTIMLELFRLNKVKDLLVVLSQMLVEGCTPDAEVYCLLIQSLSAENLTRECALLFNLLVNEGLVPDSQTLSSLVNCLANHTQLHTISTGIFKLVSNSEVLGSEMYNVLINGFWKEGLKSEASQLLDRMLEKGWVPDAKTHGLLIGSSLTEETKSRKLSDEVSSPQDSVSNILAEGLGIHDQYTTQS